MGISAHLLQSLDTKGRGDKGHPAFPIQKNGGSGEKHRYLADDAPELARLWDRKRATVDDIQGIYATSNDGRLERYAERMAECSGFLKFEVTPEGKRKLVRASFCRVPGCPICQWRRSLLWKGRFSRALPQVKAQHPKARWIHLTLTVRNCKLQDLAAMLTAMNKAWARLRHRLEFGAVQGWIRATEVTRPEEPMTAHPHFHCLLMVKPSYFGKNYITQKRWIELWRECMRLDYDPVVHVAVVKPKKGDEKGADAEGANQIALMRAAAEVLKYAVKPEDMIRKDGSGTAQDADWYREFTLQRIRKRFIATGGALSEVLREQQDEESNAELVKGEDALVQEPPPASEQPREVACYVWMRGPRRYRRIRQDEVPRAELEPDHPFQKATKAEKVANAVHAMRTATTGAQAGRASKRLAKLTSASGRRRGAPPDTT